MVAILTASGSVKENMKKSTVTSNRGEHQDVSDEKEAQILL